MTSLGARRPASLGRLPLLGGLAAAAAALLGYLLLSGAGSTLGPLVIVVGLVAVGVVVARPDLGAIVLPSAVFANAGLVLNDGFGAPNVISGLTLLVVGACLARRSYRGRLLRGTPVLVAFIVFAGIRILSAVQAPGPADPRSLAQDLLIGVAIVMVVTMVASQEAALRHSMELLVVVAAGLAGLTILKQLGIAGPRGEWLGFASDNPPTAEQLALEARAGFAATGDTTRATGPLSDANFWAQALILAVPLALWSMRQGPTRLTRIGASAAGFLIVTGVVLTQSRGGAIALVIALAVWLWFQGGRWRLAIIVLPVAIVLAVVLTGSTQRFEQLRNINDPSQSTEFRGRLSENIAAFEMWRDHPVLGVGANEFPANYRTYAAKIGLDARSERNAHNSYLQAAAETGTLGLLAFVGMIVTGLWCGLRARSRLLAKGLVSAAGCAEALIAGLVGYLCAAVLLHQAFPQYLWAWLGLLAGTLLLSGYRMRPLLGDHAK
jgi:O-antigen ligase